MLSWVRLRWLLLSWTLLGLAATANADPKPLSKEEQAKVDKAIDEGVQLLKRSQKKEGDFAREKKDENYLLGRCALPAYALLEAGVSTNDATIRKAAEYIRSRCIGINQTYELSLAILFLDRLGDTKDKKLIRSLSLRLIAGQQVTGGWSYRCPMLSKEQEKALCKALIELNKRLEASEKSRVDVVKGLELSRPLRALTVFRDPPSLPWQDGGTTDNSNTQFAILGLWAAQRHEVPLATTFRLMVERFERSQLPNGWWSYHFVDPPQSNVGLKQPSMICVGLIGLAVGRGLKLPTPGASQRGGPDLALLKGVAALRQDLSVAIGKKETNRSSFRGLYYLWSVERTAMLLDLPTIGDKDWYRWGTSLLLANQGRDGVWYPVAITDKDTESKWGSVINTSFALLFLKRSHPMKDLTPKLPVKGKELTEGVTRLLTGATPQEQSRTAPSRSAEPKC